DLVCGALHVRLRPRRRQGAHGTVSRRRHHRSQQPVLRERQSHARHAWPLRVRPADMIAASHLTKRFGARTAVADVSLDIGRSEVVALVGPNGAGKTTTMRMLAGLIAPTRGTVSIDGVELTRATGSALRGRIGFLTEAPGLWDRLTVHENL